MKSIFLLFLFLNMVSVVTAVGSDETWPKFNPPDFRQAYLPGKFGFFSSGTHMYTKTPIPPIVQNEILDITERQFESLKINPKPNSFALSRDLANHPNDHYRVYKIQLPKSFENKELYALGIGYWQFFYWYFVFYNPTKEICTHKPECLGNWGLFGLDFDDLLGDGQKEVVCDTGASGNPQGLTVKRYISCGSDLSSKEIFAYLDQMRAAQCGKDIKIIKRDHGVLTLSEHDFCLNSQGPNYDKTEVSTVDLKNFDPIGAEESFKDGWDLN